jgi:hypothetical protein
MAYSLSLKPCVHQAFPQRVQRRVQQTLTWWENVLTRDRLAVLAFIAMFTDVGLHTQHTQASKAFN